MIISKTTTILNK